MPPEIPGFFFDPVKKRYFKVERNSTNASHNYTSECIKANEVMHERKRKKVSKEKLLLEKLPIIHYDYLSVTNRLSFQCKDQSRKKMRRFAFDDLAMDFDIPHQAATDLKQICPFSDQSFLVSDLVNLYQYESVESCYRNDYSPRLLLSRIDKNTSLLRTFDTSNALPLTVRTWLGSLDEPSEIELSLFNDIGELIDSERIINPKVSFNTSLYNQVSQNIMVCCNNNLIKYDIEKTSLQTTLIARVEGDALAIDMKDPHTNYVGFRNGEFRIWDSRSKIKEKQTFKSNPMKSIINLKCSGEFGVICSSIGSNVKLFDLRMGMQKVDRSFNSTKNIHNAFGESIGMISSNEFLLQSKNLVEIYNIGESDPIKIISDLERDGEPISAARWLENHDTLLTLSPRGIQHYNFST